MPCSWDEIKTRAAVFVLAWKDKIPSAQNGSDVQSFQTGFLSIFGLSRVSEKKICIQNGADSVAVLWNGILMLLTAPGTDVPQNYQHAQSFVQTFSKKRDRPRGILICDCTHFYYYSVYRRDTKLHQFTVSELLQCLELFDCTARHSVDHITRDASARIRKLHDCLKESGFEGHQLGMYLIRLLLCFFADDTGIFAPKQFFTYLIQQTHPDGSNLHTHLGLIFDTLNTPVAARFGNCDALQNFPFVNSPVFKEEQLDIIPLNAKTRKALLRCCELDWSALSPSLFGAIFQSVMNSQERHDIGAHYTSEKNIRKVICPLFLDRLRAEFETIRMYPSETKKEQLIQFHRQLARLKILDPACGCGNFLVSSYRALRKLELSVIHELADQQGHTRDLTVRVTVDQCYGIEIEEFPALIAQTALWLSDCLMNNDVSALFGTGIVHIPRSVSASIVHANALSIDWESVVPKTALRYIVGNPPFFGSRIMNKAQKNEVIAVFDGLRKATMLDYVTCWYKKAASYIQGTDIEVAFVSTNSICQGEQAPILWSELMYKHGVTINFAHQTFKWSAETRGIATVYCVIVGFSLISRPLKKLYSYTTVMGEPTETVVDRINPYLVDAPLLFIDRRSSPLCAVSKIVLGNMPRDDGNFFMNRDERDKILSLEPELAPYIKPFLGAHEFINKVTRYCLWLKGVPPEQYAHSPVIQERLKKIRAFREKSTRKATAKQAESAALFGEIRQPATDYILIPLTSSYRRMYVPIGFVSTDIIVGNSNAVIPDATRYHFGVLTSLMHMAWMRAVCGRLGNGYRYSGTIVYNNFPWPESANNQLIETLAQGVLDVRALFPHRSLADLYDPATMPPELADAHHKLDRAVEIAYGRTFSTDSARVAYLFELYQKLHSKGGQTSKKTGTDL
ncbi:MAG: hypothetical protein LBQ77_08085 [Treponema sp.]|jgi:hypothetical protein|nr:hypothetical protein [Treponema sp.]